MTGPVPGAEIRVGVAGWDYPDWDGIVYPAGAGRGFDRLAHLSRFVDLIEINSTFYRPARPEVAESWVRRTAASPRFRFAAKTHRAWTHGPEEDVEQAVGPTLDGLRPLLDGGRLGALLLQFPQSFRDTAASRRRVDRLLPQLEGWPAVIEVRHASWQEDETAAWFGKRGLGWCVVDQPIVGRDVARAEPRVTGRLAYLRLHGRNAAEWFRPGAGRDARYDYLYSTEELTRLAETARAMAGTAEHLFVVQNNHFRGKALANALQMSRLLTGTPPLAPDGLVAAYPELEERVRPEGRRLF